MLAHVFNPSTQGQRQVEHYGFEASLVYVELKASQDYLVRPCFKKQNKVK